MKLFAFFKRMGINGKILRSRKFLKIFLKKNELKTHDIGFLKGFKKSRVLCVLGSGTSINDIDKVTWEYISQHDSLSLNNTILNKFVPNYIFYETDSDTERHLALNQIKFKNLVARSADFKDVPIIWHYQPKRYFDLNLLRNNKLLENVFFQGSYSLPGESLPEFIESLKITRENGAADNIDVGLYRRGSVARILHFTYAMQYEEVVLFGVDLVGTEYFFDHYSQKELPEGCELPSLNEYLYNSKDGLKKQNQIHMTVDPSVHKVTMIDVIEAINNHWLKPAGIKLFTGTEKSALFGKLPLKKID